MAVPYPFLRPAFHRYANSHKKRSQWPIEVHHKEILTFTYLTFTEYHALHK